MGFALAGLLIAGVWGLLRSSPGQPAAVGEAVRIPGGSLRVDAVQPEIMAPHKMPQGMMPDPVPEGYRRLRVVVTLNASAAPVRHDPKLLTVRGSGMVPVVPHRAHRMTGSVPVGTSISLTLVYQVSLDAERLMLTYPGADRPVEMIAPETGEPHRH